MVSFKMQIFQICLPRVVVGKMDVLHFPPYFFHVLLASSLAWLPFSFENMSSRRNSYTANFKLQVVAFAETTNNNIAARHFSIHEKQVREWRKKQNVLSEMPKG